MTPEQIEKQIKKISSCNFVFDLLAQVRNTLSNNVWNQIRNIEKSLDNQIWGVVEDAAKNKLNEQL